MTTWKGAWRLFCISCIGLDGRCTGVDELLTRLFESGEAGEVESLPGF